MKKLSLILLISLTLLLMISIRRCSLTIRTPEPISSNSNNTITTPNSSSTIASSNSSTRTRSYKPISMCTSEQLKYGTGICYVSSNTHNLIILDFEKKISNITSVEYQILNSHNKATTTGTSTSVTLSEKRTKERGNEFRLQVKYGVGDLTHGKSLKPVGIYYY